MSGKYDEIDVQGLRFEANRSLQEAEEYLEGSLEAMKWINRSRGKTYDLGETKKALKNIREAKKIL